MAFLFIQHHNVKFAEGMSFISLISQREEWSAVVKHISAVVRVRVRVRVMFSFVTQSDLRMMKIPIYNISLFMHTQAHLCFGPLLVILAEDDRESWVSRSTLAKNVMHAHSVVTQKI